MFMFLRFDFEGGLLNVVSVSKFALSSDIESELSTCLDLGILRFLTLSKLAFLLLSTLVCYFSLFVANSLSCFGASSDYLSTWLNGLP